jgi:large subunit ribosomal protein L6
MSRIGRLPITIPAGVTLKVEDRLVSVTGPLATLTLNLPLKINVEITDNKVVVKRLSEDKKVKSNHGTIRAHLQNMINGVQTVWKKELEIRGTGYKASVSGNKLIINAGFIHTVDVVAPEGILFQVNQDNIITVTGSDKTVVGQVASNIRKIRKPEPYKGKGIRYVGEVVKLKAGKTAKA